MNIKIEELIKCFGKAYKYGGRDNRAVCYFTAQRMLAIEGNPDIVKSLEALEAEKYRIDEQEREKLEHFTKLRNDKTVNLKLNKQITSLKEEIEFLKFKLTKELLK
ncbi:MAG: hypothetical protein QM479_10885 [Pseudomonadota bacterium]